MAEDEAGESQSRALYGLERSQYCIQGAVGNDNEFLHRGRVIGLAFGKAPLA